MRPRKRAMGRCLTPPLSDNRDVGQRREALWRGVNDLLFCSDCARQCVFFLRQASARGTGCAETTGVLRRRRQPTHRDSAYDPAKKSTTHIEKPEREEPISSPTSWQARRFQDEPTKAQSRRRGKEQITETWLGVVPYCRPPRLAIGVFESWVAPARGLSRAPCVGAAMSTCLDAASTCSSVDACRQRVAKCVHRV